MITYTDEKLDRVIERAMLSNCDLAVDVPLIVAEVKRLRDEVATVTRKKESAFKSVEVPYAPPHTDFYVVKLKSGSPYVAFYNAWTGVWWTPDHKEVITTSVVLWAEIPE